MSNNEGKRKRRSIAETGKVKKIEKHILENPFKITWPHHTEDVISSVFTSIRDKLNEAYQVACRENHDLCNKRQKRLYFHHLERGDGVLFSVNAVTKVFENYTQNFKVIAVEEEVIPTRMLDHILYFCGLNSVPLIKGPLSAYFLELLGRKSISILGVLESYSIELPHHKLQSPKIPFLNPTLPNLKVCIVDATPSQRAIDKKNLRKAAKRAKHKPKLS